LKAQTPPEGGAKEAAKEGTTKGSWIQTANEGLDAIDKILEVGGKYAKGKVATTIQAIKGLIGGIKSLIQTISSTIQSCGSALGGIASIFAGNIAGIGGAISGISQCIDSISNSVSAVERTFATTKNLMGKHEEATEEKTETVQNVLERQIPADPVELPMQTPPAEPEPLVAQQPRPPDALQADDGNGRPMPLEGRPIPLEPQVPIQVQVPVEPLPRQVPPPIQALPENVKPLPSQTTTTQTTTTLKSQFPPNEADSAGDEECFDLSENCVEWGRAGDCEAKPDYMERNCRTTCRKCTWVDPATGRTCYRSKHSFHVRCMAIKKTQVEPDPNVAFQKDAALQTAVVD
jgi:hypothetical protein